MLFTNCSVSRKPQFREYSTIPIIGKYNSGNNQCSAIYLAKSNLQIIELADIEDKIMEPQIDVYERRVAKDVLPIPLLRSDIEFSIINCLSIIKSPNSAITSGGGEKVLSSRDGGILDNLRYLLSEGYEIGDSNSVKKILCDVLKTSSVKSFQIGIFISINISFPFTYIKKYNFHI